MYIFTLLSDIRYTLTIKRKWPPYRFGKILCYDIHFSFCSYAHNSHPIFMFDHSKCAQWPDAHSNMSYMVLATVLYTTNQKKVTTL